MIRLPDSVSGLSPIERFGLAVLVDGSRLLPVKDPAADVVRLAFAGNPSDKPELTIEPVVGDGEVVLRRADLRITGELAAGAGEQASPARDRTTGFRPGKTSWSSWVVLEIPWSRAPARYCGRPSSTRQGIVSCAASRLGRTGAGGRSG